MCMIVASLESLKAEVADEFICGRKGNVPHTWHIGDRIGLQMVVVCFLFYS